MKISEKHRFQSILQNKMYVGNFFVKTLVDIFSPFEFAKVFLSLKTEIMHFLKQFSYVLKWWKLCQYILSGLKAYWNKKNICQKFFCENPCLFRCTHFFTILICNLLFLTLKTEIKHFLKKKKKSQMFWNDESCILKWFQECC